MTTKNAAQLPSRRTVLAAGVLVVGAAGVARMPRAWAAAPEPWTDGGVWRDPRSGNGWHVLDDFAHVEVEGSGLRIALAGGPASSILTHVARRWHYEIDSLRAGDLVGGTPVGAVTVPEQSNYFSGTAVGIRPGYYPVGQSGNLFAAEHRVVDDIVAECAGVVRWGGTLTVPMEGHFQIDLPPDDSRVRALATRFGLTDSIDSSLSAGTIDASDPARRKHAKAFRRQHR
jgi:hypothetical protein